MFDLWSESWIVVVIERIGSIFVGDSIESSFRASIELSGYLLSLNSLKR